MSRKILRFTLLLAVVAATIPMGTAIEAKGRCVCPQVYAPVQCAHGKIFSNQCVADCRNAKDCVPLDFLAQLEQSSTEDAYPWLDTPLKSEIVKCADERGVDLYAAPLDSVETGKMMGKGKGKPNPCNNCATTLGTCARVSCDPCCYSCPDLPYLVCVN